MSATTVKLWPEGVPDLVLSNSREVEIQGSFRYVSDPELVIYGDGSQQNRTAVIICPGGGYSQIAWERHVTAVVQPMSERGVAIVGLKYRTKYGNNNVISDALADGKRAVQIVRSRAAEFGINPQRIGVDGYSSGSNLCLNLMCRFDVSSRPDFVVLRGPYQGRQQMSEFTFGPESPPVFVASAKDDQSVSPSFAVAITEKMRTAGVAVETLMPETGGHHAFDFVFGKELGAWFPDLLIRWLTTIGMMG